MQYGNTIHVVYASDNKFAEIVGVSLVSLMENNQDIDEIIVYILETEISEENKENIVSICQAYNRCSPIFIQAKNISRELNMEVALDRGSFSQYARLFLSSMLPEDLCRVIYFDCDIIVNESIRALWEIDLEGNTIGALMDAFSRLYRKNLGLSPNDIMFNSGVMVIDLEKWRADKVEQRLLEFIEKKNGRIQQGDQGALNAILSHDTFCFDPKFNSITIFYDFDFKEMMVYRKPPLFYSESEVNRAVNNPVIIHFTTSFFSRRPWIAGCGHRYADIWMKYKEMSPWKNSQLWKDNRKLWKKALYAIVCFFPRKVRIRLAGIIQAYGRPIYNRIYSLRERI